MKSGLNIKIENPEKLGADIVAGCVGAYEKYGGPFIMIFMGTATVIVYVDENKTYLGGAIAPGVGKKCKVIATGGFSQLMAENCTHRIIADENVILDGLKYIYRKNNKN